MQLAVGKIIRQQQQVELKFSQVLLLGSGCDKWILRPGKWQLEISQKQLGVSRLPSVGGVAGSVAGSPRKNLISSRSSMLSMNALFGPDSIQF